MIFFEGSPDQNRLKHIKLTLRYLNQKLRGAEELPLSYKILMLHQLRDTKRQLASLEATLNESILGDMHSEGIDSVDTPEWSLNVEMQRTFKDIDHQEVANDLLGKIISHEKRRNKTLPEKTLENIVSTVFWKTIESSTPRWSKTKLRKQGINLEDYSLPSKPKSTLKITLKD